MMLTIAALREFVTSALPDDPLQVLLNAAEAEIIGVAGATGEITEHIHGYGLHRIVVAREIGTVTSVTEDRIVLADDDYRVSGYVLTRIGTGTLPSWIWGSYLTVVYTPADDTAERQRVQMELVKLELNQDPGMSAETIGTYTGTYAAPSIYAETRAAILASLTTGGGMRVVD